MPNISLLQKATLSFLFWLFCSAIATTAMACEFEVKLKRSCAEELEEDLLPKVPFQVQRNSNFLHLQTQAGALSFPVFKERTDEDTQPYLVSYLDAVQLAVIWVFEYCGRSVYLVNTRTGLQTQVNGFPLLSPDNKRLLVYSEGLSDKENANLVVIYRIRNHKLYAELVLSGDDNRIQPWNPLDVRWVSPEKAEFIRLHHHNGEEEQKLQSLELQQGTWQLL
ncbi:hypothetical protein [Rheinheimera soli]|uniref:Uncharacterized protein n=1 Tax=Rheinheimera soli TaxID=443616 RepID=A0ABU1VZ93_9GAMM|nr:hypothetical protein [Rheinheimera soli]MDR7121042.1 hypothetical protein [Rheinheimera soli]